MGVNIRVTIQDKEIRDLLEKVKARTGNLKPAMELIGEVMLKSVKRNFDEQGRPVKWAPLAKSTIKSRKFPDKPILQQYGNLRKITYAAFNDRVVIGSMVEKYAAIHQLGGVAGRGHKAKIPARPFLMVQDEDWSSIKDVIMEYLMSK